MNRAGKNANRLITAEEIFVFYKQHKKPVLFVVPCSSLKFTLVNAIKSYVFLPMDKYQSGHAMKKASPGVTPFLSSPRLQVAPKRAA